MKEAGKSIAKVVLFWGVFFLLLIGMQAPPSFLPPELNYLFGGSVLIFLSMLLIVLFLKKENNKLRDIGLIWESGSLKRVVIGTVSGMAVVGLMLFTLTVFSAIEVKRISNPDYLNSIGWAALVIGVLALTEEIAFCSYPLIRLSESVGIRASIYISSIVFAFYHGLDPTNLLGPGVWGLFFGLAALKTNGIALATGFHFGLNWMQSLFGMKPKYASSIWEMVPGDGPGLFTTQTVGMSLQIILLFLGVILIEAYTRKAPNLESNSKLAA